MRIVVPKLQEKLLYVTRRDVQLDYCIVPNVPISEQIPKLIQIIILQKNTPPQNLMSTSSANIVIKSSSISHFIST